MIEDHRTYGRSHLLTTSTTPQALTDQSSRTLVGRRVIVTGGTKGIGAAIAHRFTRAGANVIVAARSEGSDKDGGQFVAADLTTADGVSNLAERALEILGGVDILIDNAGGQSYIPDGVLAMTDDAWNQDLNLNLMSAVRLDRALLPSMIAQGSGVIIHVTSGQARLPGPASLPYAAAKAAATTYSKGLANEVGQYGIRVNTVVPGLIETPASSRRLQEFAHVAGTDLETIRQQQIRELGVPLERTGLPDEVAALVAFLASDDAKYITGSQYVIDGGLLPTV
jgi:NAD(P)-dependent dehydrogenase (short-subunit alcohol dehydrogenase family)